MEVLFGAFGITKCSDWLILKEILIKHIRRMSTGFTFFNIRCTRRRGFMKYDDKILGSTIKEK